MADRSLWLRPVPVDRSLVVRGALGMVVPLAVGQLAGPPDLGAAAALGAYGCVRPTARRGRPPLCPAPGGVPGRGPERRLLQRPAALHQQRPAVLAGRDSAVVSMPVSPSPTTSTVPPSPRPARRSRRRSAEDRPVTSKAYAAMRGRHGGLRGCRARREASPVTETAAGKPPDGVNDVVAGIGGRSCGQAQNAGEGRETDSRGKLHARRLHPWVGGQTPSLEPRESRETGAHHEQAQAPPYHPVAGARRER